MALTKTGLTELLAEKTGSTKAIATENLNALLDIIQDGVLGISPRKRTITSVAPAVQGLPEGITFHFSAFAESFG